MKNSFISVFLSSVIFSFDFLNYLNDMFNTKKRSMRYEYKQLELFYKNSFYSFNSNLDNLSIF